MSDLFSFFSWSGYCHDLDLRSSVTGNDVWAWWIYEYGERARTPHIFSSRRVMR